MKPILRLMTGLVLAFLLTLPVQPGCDGLPDSSTPADQCLESQGHVQLPDNWTIFSLSGDGHRQGCTEEAYNKDFEFELSQPIHVTQAIVDGQPHFTGSIGKNFQVLDGSISGRCIYFKTEETLPDEVVHRTFSGVFDEYTETFSGSFSGLGPAHCDVAGDFRAVVE
jgi:hypothetical protein